MGVGSAEVGVRQPPQGMAIEFARHSGYERTERRIAGVFFSIGTMQSKVQRDHLRSGQSIFVSFLPRVPRCQGSNVDHRGCGDREEGRRRLSHNVSIVRVRRYSLRTGHASRAKRPLPAPGRTCKAPAAAQKSGPHLPRPYARPGGRCDRRPCRARRAATQGGRTSAHRRAGVAHRRAWWRRLRAETIRGRVRHLYSRSPQRTCPSADSSTSCLVSHCCQPVHPHFLSG